MPIPEEVMIEAIMDLRAQLDFLWQFFVTVQLALFALILIYDEAVDSLNIFARLLALFGVATFSFMNGAALLDTYNLLASLHTQYRIDYGQPGRLHEMLQKIFVNADYTGRERTLLITHGTAFTVVAMALILPSFVQHRRRRHV